MNKKAAKKPAAKDLEGSELFLDPLAINMRDEHGVLSPWIKIHDRRYPFSLGGVENKGLFAIVSIDLTPSFGEGFPAGGFSNMLGCDRHYVRFRLAYEVARHIAARSGGKVQFPPDDSCGGSETIHHCLRFSSKVDSIGSIKPIIRAVWEFDRITNRPRFKQSVASLLGSFRQDLDTNAACAER